MRISFILEIQKAVWPGGRSWFKAIRKLKSKQKENITRLYQQGKACDGWASLGEHCI